ncbi:MAG TPA: DUF3631 domain-containing protein [Gaiellaceae bacterium]
MRDSLADWFEPQLDYLHDAQPDLPDELEDRAQDCWEPLLAIANVAGSDWSQRARAAALELSGNGEREDDSSTARLLRDIYTVFDSNGTDRYRTADLIVAAGHLAGHVTTAEALDREQMHRLVLKGQPA